MLSRSDASHIPPARWMAEALARKGHQLDFYETRPRVREAHVSFGVRYFTLLLDWRRPGSPLKRAAREASWGGRFLRAISRSSYDLYYAHNIGAIPWIRLAAAANRRPWIYQAHELTTWAESSGLNRAYFLSEILLARSAAVVLCPEPGRAAIMARESNLDRPPLVVRNAMPLRRLERTDDLRRALGIDGADARIVIYQGGITVNDRFEALIRSVALWPAELHLVLLGWADESDLNALRALAVAVGVERRVHFHPAVAHERLWPLLCSADVGLVLYGNTTLNERYAAPNKLGEYLMAGLPLVYTNCDGLSSFLGQQSFAIGVDVASAEKLDVALRALLAAGLLRAQAEARAFAESSFNFEREAAVALRSIELAGS